MSGPGSIPSYDADLYSDNALAEPYGHYRALRDLGPVVWLAAHGVYAVARYEDVRAVLADAETFCSGQGVGLNDVFNEIGRGTTLMSDGDDHRRLRDVIGRPLTPKALAELRPQARARAGELADRLVERSSFDAVRDLAEVLPTTWVPDLLGWPEEGREKLLDWAAATFNGFGPLNERTNAAAPDIIEMAGFAALVASAELPEGSMAAGILEAVARGDLSAGQCPMAIIDYLGPSLDTTISGLGNAIWLFATHPEQWQRLRESPGRAKQAFDEAIRLESPVTGFTRVTTRAAVIGGVELPPGARVLVSYASANRDERHWDDPERFDIERPNASHVAFGFGEHACAGMGLARLEATAVLTALARRVERFELAGTPVRKLNNVIRAFGSLPMRIVPTAPASSSR
jgi:cytochrome P450